jgi:DNA polymerase I
MSPKQRPVRSGDHVFLVDGSSYIFRAYHALPPLSRKSDGLPVGAVAGFCNMLWKLVRDSIAGEKPTHLAVVFDHSARTYRNEIYAQYKAQRPEPPEDLRPQFGLIREAVRAFDIPSIEQQGYEADDLIATYARQATEAGATVVIVASDKDLMQLVSTSVAMLDPMKEKRIGPGEVVEKFGVPPEKVVEVQALAGDSVDNIPGVPGIGVKTAAQLILEYGDLEGVLQRATEIKQPKRREALIVNAEKARISRQLVKLDDRVPLAVPLSELGVHDPDPARLIAFLKAMEFAAVTRRVAEAYKLDPARVEAESRLSAPGAGTTWVAAGVPSATVDRPPSAAPDNPAPAASPNAADKPLERTQKLPERPPEIAIGTTPIFLAQQRVAQARHSVIDRSTDETITSLARLDQWISDAFAVGFMAISLQTSSTDALQCELVGISIALAPGRSCYIPLNHRGERSNDLFDPDERLPGQLDAFTVIDRLKPLLVSPTVLKIGHNIKFLWLALARENFEIAPIDDTMLMSYVLDAGRLGHSTAELSEAVLGHKPLALSEIVGAGKNSIGFARVPIDRATHFGAEDADITYRLWHVLKARLVSERMATVYASLERPMVTTLGRIERRGIAIDRSILSRLSGEFAEGMARLEAQIHVLAGEAFNLGSPKQLGDILFGKMGLPGAKKTATGAWSTSANVLEELAEIGHELPARILEWRQLAKLKSTYTDALPNFVNPTTHRVHTSFALAATTTGRLSSSEPNLQNIPIRNEEGRKIRTAFVATPGHLLMSADYSQIELRVLAHIADIGQLKKAFSDGLDIHAMTASEMFGVPVLGMPAEVRRRAKAINFGIIYGISAFGLANQLGISREEAGAYIRRYFERFPGIRDYIETTKRSARERGYVTTIFGRKCHYPRIAASNPSERAFNERAAINAPIQGSAADIIRRAMVRMDDALDQARLSARMLLQVHDELVFEVPHDEIEATIAVVRHVMTEAPHPAIQLSVPLQVDAKAAQNWDEAH